MSVVSETTGKVLAEKKYADLPPVDVDKLMENVRLGVDPVTVFSVHTCDSDDAARREKLRAGQSALSGVGSQVCSDGTLSDRGDVASDDETSDGNKTDHDNLVSTAGMPAPKEYARSIESRRIADIRVNVTPISDQPTDLRRELTIHLRMDDRMNRQLSGMFDVSDTSEGLADELVSFGLVNPVCYAFLLFYLLVLNIETKISST